MIIGEDEVRDKSAEKLEKELLRVLDDDCTVEESHKALRKLSEELIEHIEQFEAQEV